MTTRTVYLLTSGEYSAYTVHAVFEAEAEALKCSTVDPEMTVEEFTLYSEAPEPFIYFAAYVDNIEKGYRGATPAGEVHTERKVVWPWDGYPAVPGGFDPRRAVTEPPVVYGTKRSLYVQAFHADEEQARKIAADTYAAEMVKRGLV